MPFNLANKKIKGSTIQGGPKKLEKNPRGLEKLEKSPGGLSPKRLPQHRG